jgi:hypothetical protein
MNPDKKRLLLAAIKLELKTRLYQLNFGMYYGGVSDDAFEISKQVELSDFDLNKNPSDILTISYYEDYPFHESLREIEAYFLKLAQPCQYAIWIDAQPNDDGHYVLKYKIRHEPISEDSLKGKEQDRENRFFDHFSEQFLYHTHQELEKSHFRIHFGAVDDNWVKWSERIDLSQMDLTSYIQSSQGFDHVYHDFESAIENLLNYMRKLGSSIKYKLNVDDIVNLPVSDRSITYSVYHQSEASKRKLTPAIPLDEDVKEYMRTVVMEALSSEFRKVGPISEMTDFDNYSVLVQDSIDLSAIDIQNYFDTMREGMFLAHDSHKVRLGLKQLKAHFINFKSSNRIFIRTDDIVALPDDQYEFRYTLFSGQDHEDVNIHARLPIKPKELEGRNEPEL